MKKIFLICLGFIPLFANAVVFISNGITYNLNSSTATAEVTSVTNVTNVSLNSYIYYGGKSYSLTSIANSAFEGCTTLTSISLPNSITTIGDRAFFGCTSLKSVVLPESLTKLNYHVFSRCSSLTDISIPSSVTSLGEGALYRCSSLVSITIPRGVTEIGTHAFYYCEKLAIVNCLIDNPPSVTTQTFEGISSTAILNIPSDYENNYKQKTEWTEHFNSVHAIEKRLSINVAVAGSLPELITNAEQSVVEELTLTGSLNGTDIALIRKMAGTVSGNYSLKKLDLTNAKIVYGGSAYYSYTELGSMGDVETISFSTKEDQISAYMFMNCSNLSEIKIPSNIINIGSRAFLGCTNLKTFSVPNNVSNIDSYAFSGCSSLSSISIPNSVTSIYYGAFAGCSSLSSISIPNSVTSIGGDAFLNTGWYNSQKDGILYLDNWLICYKGNFTGQIIMPNGIVGIATDALKGCLGVNSIKIPSSVRYIGSYAFSGCSGITSLTIPNSVTSIGNSAFSGCSGITFLTIGEKVTSIGSFAFSGCSSLSSIVVSSDNPTYDSRNNSNTIIETASNTLVFGCVNSTIPNSVTSIGRCAFYGCSKIVSLTIPNSVTSIDYGAFYGCSSLTNLTIGKSVTEIKLDAFRDCSSLKSFVSLNRIPPQAYKYYFDEWDYEWIEENAFDNSFNKNECVLWVPKGCLDSYKESNGWNNFQNVKEIISGDVNLDEDVNDVDRVAMIDFIMNKSPESYNRMLADLNDDDQVDAADMVLLVDNLNTGRLTAEWQFNFDYVDNSQVVSSLACTLSNERSKSIQLTRCELYCGQQLVSYITYNNSQSVELAPGESKKCSFDNLSKLDTKNGFSVAWYYVYDSESYIYRCSNY